MGYAHYTKSQKGLFSGTEGSQFLYNGNLQRWLRITPHHLCSWVQQRMHPSGTPVLVLAAGSTHSGNLKQKIRKVLSPDENLGFVEKLWTSQMLTDCVNSSGKPKQACLKETNKQTSQAMGLAWAPPSLNTGYRVPLLPLPRHKHTHVYHVCTARSTFQHLLLSHDCAYLWDPICLQGHMKIILCN